MKKSILSAVLILLFLLSGCGKGADTPKDNSKPDLDLAGMSDTMVYSELYHILSNSDDYLGKKIRIRGNLSSFTEEKTGKTYYSCQIYDAAYCCQQGIEFVLKDGDYPAENTEITVCGTFATYSEEDKSYAYISNAELQG